MDKILTKERRNALGSLLTNWLSAQDPDGRMLDTLDYFNVDKIDELINEAIAPTMADAVTCALAALAPSDAAGAPEAWSVQWPGDPKETWHSVFLNERDALDCASHHDGATVTPLFAAPVAPAAVAPLAPTLSDMHRSVIAALIDLAGAVFLAMDESEEMTGDDGRQHVIDSTNFDAVSSAIDMLDDLPDDRPGVHLAPAGKAEWALRTLLAAPTPTVAADAAAPTCRCSGLGPCEQRTDGLCRLKMAAQPDERAATLPRTQIERIARECEIEAHACPGTTMYMCAEMAIEAALEALATPAVHGDLQLAEVCEDADGTKHIQAVVEDLDDVPTGTKLYARAPSQGVSTSATRICALSNMECSHGCGTGACERAAFEAWASRYTYFPEKYDGIPAWLAWQARASQGESHE